MDGKLFQRLTVIKVQKELRLTRREDFSKIYRWGKSQANHQFVVYYLPNLQIDQFRLGVSISKKIGNAVIRNRLKRVIKEIVRSYEDYMVDHMDVILIVRKPAVGMEYKELEKSIVHVLKRAQLLRKKT